MPRFQKRADLDIVFIPGVGRVGPGRILEGEQYLVYYPSLLEIVEPRKVNDRAPVKTVGASPKLASTEAPEEAALEKEEDNVTGTLGTGTYSDKIKKRADIRRRKKT